VFSDGQDVKYDRDIVTDMSRSTVYCGESTNAAATFCQTWPPKACACDFRGVTLQVGLTSWLDKLSLVKWFEERPEARVTVQLDKRNNLKFHLFPKHKLIERNPPRGGFSFDQSVGPCGSWPIFGKHFTTSGSWPTRVRFLGGAVGRVILRYFSQPRGMRTRRTNSIWEQS